jgi:hypothetical protein
MISFGGQTKRDLSPGKVVPRPKLTQYESPSLTARYPRDDLRRDIGSECRCNPTFILTPYAGADN